ncbi:T9SS type A sorting domain-containing protein [Gaetbulibacter saemankumensis]|uniref:T9SS type A sorting domain-containing protein n=1 Tax=Gaetbulibacter saemankumensis TaxID=311208 RepID=UPI000419596C|nr:T9SS type A sorting domain-containing protein [Gaetbulibacter saemankumensis]
MMKKITILFVFLIASMGYSQEVLQSFETSGAVGAEFGSMAAPSVVTGTGSNTSEVLEIIGNPGGAVWQGVNLNLTKNVDLRSSKTMSIDVKSATPITFLVKVNGGLSGAPEAAAEVTHNGDDTWQTLSFTFNTSLDGKAAEADGIYATFVIHAYWKAGETTFGGVTTDSRTFYVDNISGNVDTCSNGIQDGDETGVDCGGSCPNVCDIPPATAAPTPPARNADDVISIFSDAYTDISVDTFDTSWCPGTTTEVMIDGNPTKKITGLGCEGVEFISGRFDATGFTKFHMDMYTNTPTLDKSFNIKFSNWDNGAGEANAIEFSITNGNFLTNPNPGTWYSFDIDLSSWTPITNAKINDVVQFVITSDLGTVYYDNVYLYKGTPLSTKDAHRASFRTYPNPTEGSWTIQNVDNPISSVKVFDVLGKMVLSLTPNTLEVQVDGSSLKSGLYFAQVQTERGTSSLKLIKN